MKKHWYISATLALGLMVLQGNAHCPAQPAAPVLRNVTVNHSPASATLTWTASPSAGVAGYVVYRYRNNEGYAIDTLWNPATLSFTDFETGATFFSEAYVVAAIDSELNISPLSNPLSTIYLAARLDTCSNKIDISWSEYTPVVTGVTAYKLYASADGGEFMMIHSTEEAGSVFEWTGFGFGRSYTFMARALMGDGSVSDSNRVPVLTDIDRPPAWLIISNVTVNSSGRIVISARYDQLTELSRFMIMRREGDGEPAVAGSVISTGGSFDFTDTQATATGRYTYTVGVINNCGASVLTSGPAGNMVLTHKLSDNTLTLAWNRYTGWAEGVDRYILQYHTGNSIFSDLEILSPADSSVTLDFRNLMYEITGSEICFRLTALGNLTDGAVYQSVSNTTCIDAPDSFFMPNAFTPDGNGLNDFFGPVMAFTPTEFLLIIRDRGGRVLFRTSNYAEQWNGTWRGGKLPPDVYLWFLRIKTPSGKLTEKTGTVALIYNN